MRTWVEINTTNLRYNIKKIQSIIGDKKIIGVVKANSYGLGSVEITRELEKCDIDYFAVATLEEGIELREGGIEGRILILAGIYDDELETAEKYNLEIALSRFEQLEYIHKNNINIKCQLPIETGMGRVGFSFHDLDRVARYIEENNLTNVIGVYTHLSVADETGMDNKKYTEDQIRKFNTFKKIKNIECRHVLNSGGILGYSDLDEGNFVRAGIIMYGICGEKWVEGFKPVITFKAKVLFIKTLEEDSDISYGRAARLPKGDMVATISAGYADGFKRGGLNKITVKIQGIDCVVVGKICMDMFMVRIPEELKGKIEIGEEVILYGEDLVEKSKLIGASVYEVITGINERVKRVYLEEK